MIYTDVAAVVRHSHKFWACRTSIMASEAKENKLFGIREH